MNKLLLVLVLILGVSICVTGCNKTGNEQAKQETKDATKTDKPKQDAANKGDEPPEKGTTKKIEKQEPEKEEAIYKGKTAKEWTKQLKDRDETIQLDALNALGQLKSDADTKECIQALIMVYKNPLSTDRVQNSSKNVLLELPPESVLVEAAKGWAKVWRDGGREDDKYGRLVYFIDDYNLSRNQAVKALAPLTNLLREAVKTKDSSLCGSVATILGGYGQGLASDAVPVLQQARSVCQGIALQVVENAIKKHGPASK